MIEKDFFGKTAAGREVGLFTLANGRGLSVEVLDFGCVIRAVWVPDRRGERVNVALGYDTLAEYEADDCYLGALVGRWANRISGACFELNGRKWPLPANLGPHHLHGGPGGFHRQLWRAEAADGKLFLSRTSPAGEEGYPGNLDVRVVYELTEDNELILSYEAESDEDTIINLTNHSYFNLAGRGDILDHELSVAADFFSEVDGELIPTGRLLPVAGGPFDFRKPKAIGRDMGENDEQLIKGRGYDHNFALRPERDCGQPIASAFAANGIQLTVSTTLPGLQLYSGNFLTDRPGKAGQRIGPRSGFCLETQFFPDSVNQAGEKPILKKGALYQHRTTYGFAVC